MDLSELIVDTRERLGEVGTADFFTDDEITRALNEGLRRFSNEERWPWLFTDFEVDTVVDTNTFEFPSDVSINRVFQLAVLDDQTLAGGQKLERVTPMEGVNLKRTYRQSFGGCPRWYYISSTNLDADGEPPLRYTATMIPTPDREYTISGIYMFVPNALSGDSDEPQLPREYQDALPAYAAGKLFLNELQISQKASEQFGLYNAVLTSATRETKQFNVDEVVAWARSKPSGQGRKGFYDAPGSFWSRIGGPIGQ